MPGGKGKKTNNSVSPLLQTYPNLNPAKRDSAKEGSGAIPSDADVVDAKRWVEENEL